MKKISSLIMVLAVVSMTAFGQDVRRNYIVDTDKTVLTWKGMKVTGSHYGTVMVKSGSLQFNNKQLAGGEFVIDMTSISVSDLEGEMKGKLEGHLKSPDFFGIENHPSAKLKITSVVSRGTPGEYKVIGDLTIKETTAPVKFNVKMDETTNTATAQIEIDRTVYDVRYGSGSFFQNLGDKTIYDEFKIEVMLALQAD